MDQQSFLEQPSQNAPQEEWRKYWASHHEPWRTEPEISEERQGNLRKIWEEKNTTLHAKVLPVTLADIEWLLHTFGQPKRKELDSFRSPFDKIGWRMFWTFQGEPWRTEPEISEERRDTLTRFRNTVAAPDENIYPFKDLPSEVPPLTRADIEWLLHDHDQTRGPIDWSKPDERQRKGLDLRGAKLKEIDLSRLPLAKTLFSEAHLEGTSFRGAHCEGAFFSRASLKNVEFGVSLKEWFGQTPEQESAFEKLRAELNKLNNRSHEDEFKKKRQERLDTLITDAAAFLEATDFSESTLVGVSFRKAHLERANFYKIRCKYKDLNQITNFHGADLQDASFRQAILYGVSFNDAHLEGADFRLAFFDDVATLKGARMGYYNKYARLADVRWNGVNMAEIIWGTIWSAQYNRIAWRHDVLGDEIAALRPDYDEKKYHDDAPPDELPPIVKDHERKISDWQAAVRAYRQVAIALRSQGVNDQADHFAYRAHLCQRRVSRLSTLDGFLNLRYLARYIGSVFLDTLAGYGYDFLKTIGWYIIILLSFTSMYVYLGHISRQGFSGWDAFFFSVSSFHGRGFFPANFTPDDPNVKIAAIEAIVGVLIEVSFIATFTQRFFGRE
jgi:uncharacterized protein YjbI with pentapeptide repeats